MFSLSNDLPSPHDALPAFIKTLLVLYVGFGCAIILINLDLKRPQTTLERLLTRIKRRLARLRKKD